MKKIISLALVALTVAALALPVFAVEKIGANSAKIKATFQSVATAPKMDGVVSANEYGEIKYTADDLRFSAGKDDATLAAIQKYAFKIYAAYDAKNVYVAVVSDAPDYIQTATDAASLWQQYCLQVSCAKAGETTAANRGEYGFGLNSATKAFMFNSWADAYSIKWAPVGGTDYNVAVKDKVITYEVTLPAKLFGLDALKKGDSLRINLLENVGLSSSDTRQIEWSQGCGGSKNATQFAVATLGDALPVATTAAATTAKAAATTTTKAAQTADVSIYVAVAVMVVSLSAAFVVSKKRKA